MPQANVSLPLPSLSSYSDCGCYYGFCSIVMLMRLRHNCIRDQLYRAGTSEASRTHHVPWTVETRRECPPQTTLLMIYYFAHATPILNTYNSKLDLGCSHGEISASDLRASFSQLWQQFDKNVRRFMPQTLPSLVENAIVTLSS